VSTPRRQRSRPTESANGRPARERGNLALEGGNARVDEVECVQVVVAGGLPRRLVEALLREPAPAADAPGLRRHPALVAQEQLAEPVAGAHPLDPRILACPDQIAGRLELGRGDVDRLEQPGRVQLRQLARIPGSVLIRSPGRCGTRPGATTTHSIPRSVRWRYSPKPVGPAS
jgi:hypothetical protein